MPMPKSKITRARRGHRRSHDFLTPPTVNKCSNCGSLVRPHRVCVSCGHYKGKVVVPGKE